MKNVSAQMKTAYIAVIFTFAECVRVCPSVSECVQLSVLTVQLHVTRQLLLLHRRE